MLQEVTCAQSSANLKQKAQVTFRDVHSGCRNSQTTTTKLCPESYSCLNVREWRPKPSLLRPSVCPATHYRKLWFFWRRTTINPYSLLLLSDTLYTLHPPSPSCSQMVMVVSIKHAQCIHDVPIQYSYTVTMQHSGESSDNRELTKLVFLYTMTSLRHI